MNDINHIYKVGKLIAKLRENKGLSQSELGNLLGVTNKAVSRWETGRGYPDTSLLLQLSKVLDITVDELLKGEISETVANHKLINNNINYEAEKALFTRFSLTIIPCILFIIWFFLCLKYTNVLLKGLDYGEMWLVSLIIPLVLCLIINVILGLFVGVKLHKRKDINLFTKIIIFLGSVLGFLCLGSIYIVIYLYMIVRFIIARFKKNKVY